METTPLASGISFKHAQFRMESEDSVSSTDSEDSLTEDAHQAETNNDGPPISLLPVALPHTTQFLARLLLADGHGKSKLDHVGNAGENALHYVVRVGDVQLVQIALIHNADPNIRDAEGYTPLHIAANTNSSNNGEITRLLLQRTRWHSGADPNTFAIETTKRHALSPLHIAAQKDNKHVAEELIKGKAQIDIADPIAFWTPLCSAVTAGHDKMVRLLLAKGANVDGDHRASASPLIRAVSKKRIDLVQILLCCGADLNRLDMDGEPAIHTAAWNGSLDIVQLLLAMSDDNLDLKGAGRPAWSYAQRAGHHGIAKLLREREAQLPREREAEAHPSASTRVPPDLEDDSRETFGDIGESKMLKDITRAQQYIYRVQDPDRPESWKERIRFVVKAKEEDDYDLEVIEPYITGQDSQEPFIAVSYCWSSQNKSREKPLLIKVPNKSGSGSVVRPTRARTELIRRSLEFAHSKGIRRVWIDQECIHQDDAEDKKILVGTMHRLYRQATFTLAMLGKHIQSVNDIDTMSGIFDKGPTEARARISGSMGPFGDTFTFLGRIFRDKWFVRAWTTQEALSAISHAGNLLYLLEWDDNFDRSGTLWQEMITSLPTNFPEQRMPRNLTIDWPIVYSLSFRSLLPGSLDAALIQNKSRPNAAFTLGREDLKQQSWYASRDFTKPVSDSDALTRFASAENKPDTISSSALSMAEPGTYTNHQRILSEKETADHHAMAFTAAIAAIRGKRSLMVSDKLIILANVAGFEYHLDIAALLEADSTISFSACALALSFANGDVSSLTDRTVFDELSAPETSATSWLLKDKGIDPPRAPPHHTWTGKIATLGNPCVLVNEMLVARGVLWKVEPCQDLLPLKDVFKDRLEFCQHNPSEVKSVGVDILQATLKHLLSNGKEQLTSLIITMALNRSWESPAELDSAMDQLRSWHTDGGSWPSLPWGDPQEPNNPYSLSSRGDVEGVTFVGSDALVTLKEPIMPLSAAQQSLERIPSSWGCSLLRWVYLTVVDGCPLPIGTCWTGGLDRRREIAVFKNFEGSTLIFVPMSELNYNFSSDRLLTPSAKSFWKVRKAKPCKVSDEEKTRAITQLKALNAQDLRISDEAFTIEHEIEMEGCWSPLLSTSGILSWNNQSKSYFMTSLGDMSCYYFIK